MKKNASKNKTFPVGTCEDNLKDTNRKLKAKIRRLQSDKRKLLSEIQQYKTVFLQTQGFLKNSTKDFILEEVIERVNKNKPLHDKNEKKPKQEIKCPACASPIKPLNFAGFDLHTCKCGYRKRIEKQDV